MHREEPALRAAVVEAMRSLERLGLVRGTSGNVGVRCGDGLLVTPTGVAPDRLRPEQVVFMRGDGSFDGETRPTSEWQLHRDLLRDRPEFNAVVHTHSPQATAVSILGHDLPAVHYMVAAAGGKDVRCARYATFGSAELSSSVVEAMRCRRACLMAHHGAVAAHVDLDEAIALAVTVEELARLYLAVLPFGRPPVLDDAEMERVVARFAGYGQPRRT